MRLRLSLLQGIAVALSIVSMKHLKVTLDQLQVYSAILTDKNSSSILKLMKVMAFLGAPPPSHTKPSKASLSPQAPHSFECCDSPVHASISCWPTVGKFHPLLPFPCSFMTVRQALVSPAGPPTSPLFTVPQPHLPSVPSRKSTPLWTSISPSGEEARRIRLREGKFPPSLYRNISKGNGGWSVTPST